MWDKTHCSKGGFNKFCGVYAFNGVLRGPQESNRPYRFNRRFKERRATIFDRLVTACCTNQAVTYRQLVAELSG